MTSGRCTFCGSERISEPTCLKSWSGGKLFMQWDLLQQDAKGRVKETRVRAFAESARVCGACGHAMLFVGPKARAALDANLERLRPLPVDDVGFGS
jgi:hypothetical protein